MNSLTIRVKRRSRGGDTLLEAATRILSLLGVNTTKRVKQPMPKNMANPPRPAEAPSATAVGAATAPLPTAPATPPTKRSAKDFIFGKVIGEGCFSTVYLAKDIHTGKEYAIKVCEKRHIMREKKAEYIKREKDVLNMLFNCERGFVRLFCTFQDADRLYFVLSYAKNGELLPYINKVGSFDLDVTRFYAAELVVALEQMHAKGIIHRDLKPENLLLDERMHILITDFGSAKILQEGDTRARTDGNDEECERRRRMSFVGTAQYVSPELLTDKCVSNASDLWALGCIIYQMISGLPPFRAGSEYLIFQKIINLDYEFPEGFPSEAQDLVQKLLVLDPSRRLGAQDVDGTYASVRAHPLFRGMEWDELHSHVPPAIHPFLPGFDREHELHSQYSVPDHLEPGLGDHQMARLLQLDLADTSAEPSNDILNISPEDYSERLRIQRDSSKWHQFTGGDLIIKQGLVEKRKGLFARRRMLLLTAGRRPRLLYVDPTNMILKGEIPFSEHLRTEPKNFRIFFVHTPNRTYYLEDPESYALEWCKIIDEVRFQTYPENET